MDSGMALANMLALLGAMAVLAAVPSVSVLTVSARSASDGFAHGAYTALGIVVGDVVFILVAVLGLAVLAETLGGWFVLIKYAGGAYLIWLGITLWRGRAPRADPDVSAGASPLSSFLSGLLITLGDQKAILFYLGFFPAFVDLWKVTFLDTAIIIVIAIVAVGGVKLLYAYLAYKTGALLSRGAHRALNIVAGSVLVAVGSFVMAFAW